MKAVVRIIYFPNADPETFEQQLKRLKEIPGIPENICICKENANKWGFQCIAEQYRDIPDIVDAIMGSGVLQQENDLYDWLYDWEVKTFIKSV